mmetsp:Transcript_8939/g.20440  ORF Transcript_8939/g.20440 Transcript_8939/m.20440 type:complete len:652 (-) Transcript_8939:590-2545(-)
MSVAISTGRSDKASRDDQRSKFAARRVPDFARLHALEDARVARWKRQHSKKVTVPLNFRLAPASTQQTVESESENVDSVSEKIEKISIKQAPYDARQKENESSQAVRSGPPSDAVLYPTAFNRNARASKAPHTRLSTTDGRPSSGTLRPLSQRDAHPVKVGGPAKQSMGSSTISAKVETTSRGSDLDKVSADSLLSTSKTQPINEGPTKRADSAVGVSSQGGAGRREPAEKAVHPKKPASDADAQSGGKLSSKQSGAVSDKEGSETKKVDMVELRRILSTLSKDSLNQPFSSIDFYNIGKTLGEGAYGKVRLATHLLTNERVAVKTFEKSKLTEPQARSRVAREIRILKALSHPNIIKLYEVVDVPFKIYLIMQFSSGGDLCKYVRENRKLSEAESCRLFVQIVQGLEHCHNSGIVHRDVKLDNLLIDENKNIKIVDFGFSVSFKPGQKLKKACGSPSYAAPEIVARKPYNPTSVDIWSLGVVLYAMVCGYFPFQGSSNQELCRRIVKGKFDCPSFMSQDCKDLIRRMLTVDSSKRAEIVDIKQHSWCRTAFARHEAATVRVKVIDSERSEDYSVEIPSEDQLEVDDSIARQMVEMGFNHEYVENCVKRNVHNVCSTTYQLLVQRREKSSSSVDGGSSFASQQSTARRMMV